MKKKYAVIIDSLYLGMAILTLLMALMDFLKVMLPFTLIMVFILLLLSIPVVAKGPKYYSLSMLILGALLLNKEKADYQVWQEAISSNINLLTLFVLIPLLSIPVRYGGYTENINGIFRKLFGVKWKIHAFSSSLMGLLAPILTLGSVTMLKDLTPQLNQEKTFIVSLSRMFGLTLCWTPYFGTVIFMLTLLKIDWEEIFPFTFTFAFVGMLISILFERIFNRNAAVQHVRSIPSNEAVESKKLIELIFIISLILLSTLGIYYTSHLSMTISICLISIFVPILWLFYLRKIHALKECFTYYLYELLPKLKGEILLMLSAGFFGTAFVHSSYSHVIPNFLNDIAGNHPLPFILLLSFIMIFIPVLGIHPFVMTSIFAATLSQGGIPVSQLVLAFVILCSWALALVLSPFSTATLVVSRGTSYSPYKVSVNWNLGYIGVLFVLLVFSAYCLNLLGF